MKKRILPLCVVSLFIVVLFGSSPAMSAGNDKDVAAIINGEKITVNEINRVAQGLPQYYKLQLDVLNNMIVQTLLYQESVKAGIKVDKAEIDKGFQEYKTKLSISDETVKQELKKFNLTEEGMKTEMMKGLMVDRFIKQRESGIVINATDEEAKKYYDEHPETFNKPERVSVRHILVHFPQGDAAKTEEAKKKIADIKNRIKKGESFSELAKQFSDDKQTASSGGEIKGEIIRNDPLPKSFIDAAFALEKGKTSEAVKTEWGYHLIQLIDKKPAEKATFSEIKETLKNKLKDVKRNAEFKKYVDSLADKSKIEIKLDKQSLEKKNPK